MKYRFYQLQQPVFGLVAKVVPNDSTGAQLVIETGNAGVAIAISEVMNYINASEIAKAEQEKKAKEELENREMANPST